jgi:hypothetical protein
MLEKLDAFDKKATPLGSLISGLDGLLNALEGADEQWKNAFLKQWGVLEDVYANALDKTFAAIPIGHMMLVNKAIGEIRKLIAQKL